jgi:hypothetical protein
VPTPQLRLKIGETMNVRIGLLVLATLLVLAACVQSSDDAPAAAAASMDKAAEPAPSKVAPTPPAGAVDVCALLTPDDLAAVLPEVPFATPEPSARPGAPGMGSLASCAWTRADETTEQTSIEELQKILERATTVNLMLWDWPDQAGAESYVQSFVDAGTGPVERIDSLGDAAVATAAPASGVHFRLGSRSASVSVTGRWLDDAARRQIELDLARRVSERL